MNQCLSATMTQGSTHTIKLNAVEPLTAESVSSMLFEVFRVGKTQAFISKSIGSGIVLNDDHWLVTIPGGEVNISGEVERQLKFTSNDKQYVIKYGYIKIEPTK